MKTTLVGTSADGRRVELRSPTLMPRASACLWNPQLLLELNCRGYAIARHRSAADPREHHQAAAAAQPEHQFFPRDAGRFVYLRDEMLGKSFSLPYEPVRQPPDRFEFCAGTSEVRWTVEYRQLRAVWQVALAPQDPVELWTLELYNLSGEERRLGIYPYFPAGEIGERNVLAHYSPQLQGIAVRSDLGPRHQGVHALPYSCLLPELAPLSWECRQAHFEGEGGLRQPDALQLHGLARGRAHFERACAALQYRLTLLPGERRSLRFVYGSGPDQQSIQTLRRRFLRPTGFELAQHQHRQALAPAHGCLSTGCPDVDFSTFTSIWLPHQVYRQGALQRLAPAPPTRDYLQDAMGMVYLDAGAARTAVLRALSQQGDDGRLPARITLHDRESAPCSFRAENAIWLVLCLEAYLRETADRSVLTTSVQAHGQRLTVAQRVTRALAALLHNTVDHLGRMSDGDWCEGLDGDGMGHGAISTWASFATVCVLQSWEHIESSKPHGSTVGIQGEADAMRQAAQARLWQQDRFARGLRADGTPFGVSDDTEGRLFLDAQSWSVLAEVATPAQCERLRASVDRELATPDGAMLLAPAFTRPDPRLGTLTLEPAGCGHNGGVFTLACMWFALALYRMGDADAAYQQLRHVIPGPDAPAFERSGQLPLYLADYARGAGDGLTDYVGRSSHDVHSSGAAWMYQLVIEELFGLRGEHKGLRVAPQLPSHWQEAYAERRFRSARFQVHYMRKKHIRQPVVFLDNKEIPKGLIEEIESGQLYHVVVNLPWTTKA